MVALSGHRRTTTTTVMGGWLEKSLFLFPSLQPTRRGPVLRHNNNNSNSNHHGITAQTVVRLLLLVGMGACVCLFFLLEVVWIHQQQHPQQPHEPLSPQPRSDATTLVQKRLRAMDHQPPPDPVVQADAWFNGVPLTLRTTNVRQLETTVHCVGDNYWHMTLQASDYETDHKGRVHEHEDAPVAWKGRSCHFAQHFCFNTTLKRFVIWESQADHVLHQLQSRLREPQFLHMASAPHFAAAVVVVPDRTTNHNHTNNNAADPTTTTTTKTVQYHPKTVSLGGINLKWGTQGMDRLQWFPDVVAYNSISSTTTTTTEPISYYELPPSVVWIPFHSLNGGNPGHLVWDDFLPIYNVLDMFDLVPNQYKNDDQNDKNNNNNNHNPELLLMRYILQNNNHSSDDPERGLWASCDWNQQHRESCHKMIDKFIPLLVGTDARARWSTNQNFELFQTLAHQDDNDDDHNKKPPSTDLVCASHGVAGLGSLTDHGFAKLHGWVPEDYDFVYNHGRGGLLRAFRHFAVQNLHLPRPLAVDQAAANQNPTPPWRIVFSVNSSDIPARTMDFATQVALVRQYVPTATVETHVLAHMTLLEQVDLIRQTHVLVTMCGGGAVTAMFLPPGASVVLFYMERGGIRPTRQGNRPTHQPAMLDWDLFTSMTHIRVNWMPTASMNENLAEQMAFVALIRRELQLSVVQQQQQ
ncbi:hypothetical protein ACA910_007217 [Epithemia clementina (nom. ined.)]